MTDFVEPGCHVSDGGLIVIDWPPEGRFAELWKCIEKALPSKADKRAAVKLLARWQTESDNLVEHTVDRKWVDVELKWDAPTSWLDPFEDERDVEGDQ